MLHHGAVSKLPVELVSLILDHLLLRDILCASLISSFWRAVAFRHPAFWRDITLTSLTTPALDLYNARLDASSNQSINIYVCLPSVDYPARLRSVVLPAVARNLHRLDGLYFQVDIAYDADVFGSLLAPAPRLQTFDVYFVHDTRTSDALPLDLFAGDAPALRYLQLQNVQLMPDHLPDAFSAVSVLVYGFRGQQPFPTAIFTHCKALQELHIWGKRCVLHAEEDRRCIQGADRLVSFNMATNCGGFLVVQQMPCASIPHTSVPLGDIASAQFLLSHLRGRLEVELFRNAEEALVLQYRSRSTDMRRGFLCTPDQAVLGTLPAAYTSADLLSRIEGIRASEETTNLLSAFACLPSCTRATFTLTDGARLTAPSRSLNLPALCSVDISCPTATTITVADLVAFLDSAFHPVSRVVKVTLDGVALAGDVGALPPERFMLVRDTSSSIDTRRPESS